MNGSLDRICVTHATAIAMANAVVKHTKQGLFISQFSKISAHLLNSGKFTGAMQVSMSCRTNTNIDIQMVCTLIYATSGDKGYPFAEKVYVTAVDEIKQQNNGECYAFFECTFGVEDILITQLKKSTHGE